MITVDRKRFIGLCAWATRFCAGRRSTSWVEPEVIKELMPPKATATLLGCVTGGDELYVITRWHVPTNDGEGTAMLVMPLTTLHELELKAAA